MAFRHKILLALYIVLSIPGHATLGQGLAIRTYHDQNQTILKEIFFISDSTSAELNGPYKSYYINGKLEKQGFYKHNQPDSLWIFYFENGGIKMQGTLKNGMNHGLWQYYFENGNLNMTGIIIDAFKEGNWKYYYENGNLKSEGNFLNDKREGIWNYFYEEGQLKAQAFYEKDSGKYTEFYASGKIKAEGINSQGTSHGPWIFFYENGQTMAKGNFDQGRRTGPWIYFFENGEKSAEGQYDAGEKEGKWVHYHENGQISSEGAIKEGKKEGYWKFFNRNGTFNAEGVFVRDDGKYKEYYESGKLKTDGNIKNGKNHGKWKYYYENGSLEGECDFVDGDGEYTGYHPDGTIKMKGRIANGANVGIWELYEGDGTLAGYYRPYYEDNKPVYKLVDKGDSEKRGNTKPAYKFKSYKSRYFDPVINEYNGFILSTNPFSMFFGELPILLEYYIEERLGYELQIGMIRNPFFTKAETIDVNKVFDRGFNIALKQKFYHPEGKFGMFYFGHEVRLTSLNHYANVIDSTVTDLGIVYQAHRIQTKETRFEYAFFVGDRWMHLFGERYKNNYNGFTIDAFVGFGFGYRLYQEKYAHKPEYDAVFNDLNTSKFAITPRLGVTFGFIF